MKPLDSSSIYLTVILIHAIFAVAILGSSRAWRSRSLRFWGVAEFIGGVALILLAYRGIWPDFVTKTIAIFLVSTSFSLSYLSIALFFNLRYSRMLVVLPPVVSAIFFSFPLDQVGRNIISGLINGGQLAYILWVVLRKGTTSPGGPRFMLASGAFIMSGGFLWRAAESIWFPEDIAPVAAATDPVTLLAGLASVALQTTGILMLHWDHSDGKLRAQREVALKLSANRTRFLAAASHDLRQPLQAMTYILDDLGAKHLNASQVALHTNLVKAVGEMRSLLDSILDVARFELGGVAAATDAILVDDLFERLDKDFSASATAKGLRWKLFWPTGLYLHTDQHLLYSLVSNLVSNAIKHTERGGVLVAARRRGRCVCLQVIDTGIGISARHGERIFEEFYQVNNPSRNRGKGIGLGLFIVRRLTDTLRCDLRWRSILGRGSVFTLYLPKDMDTMAPTAPGASLGPPVRAISGLHIVVLEDDDVNREAMKGWLRSMGNDAWGFSSAEAAMADRDLVSMDLFVVDYQLGGKLNGLQFLKQLEQSRGGVPAVIVTGFSAIPGHELADSHWPVLTKPVAPADLMRALHKQLALHPTLPA